MRLLSVLGIVLLSIACTDDASSSSSGGKSPPLSDYDQTCTKDDECAYVYTGPTCSCSCEVGGVNKKDQPRYVADRKKLECTNQPDCGPCQSVRAVCKSGRCAAETCAGLCQ